MKCLICEDSELYMDYSYNCAKCFSFFRLGASISEINGYNINGDSKIFLSIENNSDIFIGNYYTGKSRFIIKIDIKNLKQKEIYELLRSIANNLEFL